MLRKYMISLEVIQGIKRSLKNDGSLPKRIHKSQQLEGASTGQI